MDDILVYRGETEAEHQAYVERILPQCVNHELADNLTKSSFHIYETVYRCHIVNSRQVQMDTRKLESMSKWPVPTKRREVQPFSVFTNDYSRVIENYSAKARPLVHLSKNAPFICGQQQQQAFDELRTRFLFAPILTQFDQIGRAHV